MNSITINNWYKVPKKYTGHVKHANGMQAWYKDGSLHREDGPAVIMTSGSQYWYLNDIYILF